MKPRLKALGVVVAAAFAIIGGIFSTSVPALAQTYSTDTATSGNSMDMGGDMMAMMRQMSANHKWGAISSIQNDEQGQPGWIVAGHWMIEMGSQNDTATSNTTSRISNVSGFHATLQMVRLNGSAMHNHEISNFTQTGDATFNGDTNSTTITGTATITLREGPVPNVPITIEIAQDKVIAITPDPAAVQNHFGNTPIYGIVISPEMIKDMMMEYGEGMHMMNNMTGMGGGMMQGPSSGNAGALSPSERVDAGETPGALPPSESLDAGETPPIGSNMTTNSSGGT
jgi:hypothetical protein